MFLGTAFAQETPVDSPKSPQQKTGSATSPAEVKKTEQPPGTTGKEAKEPPAPELFQLPVEHHLWARFQPGAWRELQTVTETFDEAGQVVSRNITTQKEVLQAVAEEKYVLQVQATVELGGKRIEGDRKNRVLHLATDCVGQIAESRRIEDRSLSLAGHEVACRVFEIDYREESRNLTELVHYDPLQFPFVLRRETFAEKDTKGTAAEATVETEQLMEVIAQEVPYRVGGQLLDCSLLRTFRHRTKGDSVWMTMANVTVPGGKVAVWTTEFDAQGKRVRWSVTTLLAFGESSPEDPESPK